MGKETMKFKILDTRKNGAWVLAKVSAWEYLEQLSSDFFTIGCKRYRPEDIAASSALYDASPATCEQIQANADQIYEYMKSL